MNSLQYTRAVYLFFISSTIYSIIIFYFAFIQVLHADFFVSLGTQQYHSTLTQLPARAPILDRNGHPLACNKECISAFVIPNQLQQKNTLFSFLQAEFPLALERIKAHPHSSFIYLKRRLSDKDLEIINAATLPDIHFLCETSRFYPLPTAAPLIGFTNIDNVGQSGIELAFNDQLMGSATKVSLQKDARSGYFYFHKELQHQGKNSMPIQLSIDSTLQFLIDQEVAKTVAACQAKEGAALIMDPTTGEIIVMSCYPFSTPSSASFSIQDTKQKVVTESYEFGSVIKVAAAIAALQEGVVTPDELINCKNRKTCTIDGRTINTLTPHGIIPFYDVVALSNNIGIAQVAKRLNTKIYDHYRKMGFGSKTGITLPAESPGFVNHPSNWSKQSIISLSYGYEISATLLQLGCLFCTIANDGKRIAPHLVMNSADRSITPLANEQTYSPQTMHAIKDMLRKTTEHGTGWRSRLAGYDIMTKTGTANMLYNGSYRKSNDLLSCAGIIEKDRYKRVIISFIKQAAVPNAYASTIAVPFFKRIAETMIIHERVV